MKASIPDCDIRPTDHTPRNELLALVAHELRNPLSVIAMAATVIKRSNAPQPAIAQATNMIERQVIQLIRLVDDITDVTRLMTNKITLQPQKIQTGIMCERAIETVRPLIDSKHHRLKVDIESIEMMGDPIRLQQVIVNILCNAIKFTPNGGIITLCVFNKDDNVLIIIEDNGKGINVDSLSKVFDMFFQEDNTAGGGLGIGLTLSQNIVALHDGTIIIESPGENKGTKVTITLPLTHHGQSTGLRVLVIDDNADHANVLCTLLELEDYKAKIAFDGESGLAEIETFKPDVVFLDIGMPGMDGYEVMSKITKANDKPYVVAVTGFGQSNDKMQTKTAGFDAHLVKPPNIKELIDILQLVAARK